MDIDIDFLKKVLNDNQWVLALVLFIASIIIAWISGLFKYFLWKFNNHEWTPYIKAGGTVKAGGDIIVWNWIKIQKSGNNSQNIQGENITFNLKK